MVWSGMLRLAEAYRRSMPFARDSSALFAQRGPIQQDHYCTTLAHPARTAIGVAALAATLEIVQFLSPLVASYYSLMTNCHGVGWQ